MKNTNMFLAYICILTITLIIGIPAYVTGCIDVLFAVSVIALLATIIVARIIAEIEENYYED